MDTYVGRDSTELAVETQTVKGLSDPETTSEVYYLIVLTRCVLSVKSVLFKKNLIVKT